MYNFISLTEKKKHKSSGLCLQNLNNAGRSVSFLTIPKGCQTMVHIFLVTQRQGDLGHRNEDRLKPEATLARASPMPSGASRPGSAVAARAPVPRLAVFFAP